MSTGITTQGGTDRLDRIWTLYHSAFRRKVYVVSGPFDAWSTVGIEIRRVGCRWRVRASGRVLQAVSRNLWRSEERSASADRWYGSRMRLASIWARAA